MPVVVTCRCGQSFRAIDELAGKRVNCPSCGQPLAIPPLPPATSSADDTPLDLGNVSGFEQSAAPVHDSLAGAEGHPLHSASAAHSSGLPRQAAGMDRSVVLALWIGGGVVVVLILAMVLTSLLSGSGDTSTDQSVAEAEPEQTPAAVPAEAEPKGKKAEKAESNSTGPKSAADRPNADAPAKPRKNRQKQPSKTRPHGQSPKRATRPVETRPAQDRSSANTNQVSIALSAGTALPQTLPTGTAMGFSVDYKFTNGQPDTSAEYLWVIQAGDGRVLKEPVRLQSRGTLQDFVQQLRPENGPFQTHIEDQRGARLSESLRLR